MKKLILFFCLTVISFSVFSQELKYKSAFTLNFIRYVGWSDEQTKGDFVIGVVGKSDLFTLLKEQSNGRKFGYQNILIKDFSSVDKIQPCQVLYVGEGVNFAKNFDRIVANGGGKGFLLITEASNSVEKGSMINFVLDGDVIKFEISDSNAKRLGLTINSKLSSMTSAIKR